MGKSKEPIRLRRRKMPSGNTSLYLDIYLDGNRKYEYLKMYLVPERSRADKEKNRETLLLAQAICSKRIVELRNNQYGFNRASALSADFFAYFQHLIDKKEKTTSDGGMIMWKMCLRHMKIYEKRSRITFADVTRDWVIGFKDYLENKAMAWAQDKRKHLTDIPLSQNTKSLYFSKLRSCMIQACKDGIITFNPMLSVENIKMEETKRMYLTLDEVKKLAATECEYQQIKVAFLFSCLTGLRRSDIESLTWGEVYEQGEYKRIIFRQKKTHGQEYLDITKQAAELMGERGKSDEKVFARLHSVNHTNDTVQKWVYRAGIDKKITFHCARHTFATLMLDLGTDIYTVSKLLGHREVSTTQIYAKVMDKSKQEAVSRIPNIFNKDDSKN